MHLGFHQMKILHLILLFFFFLIHVSNVHWLRKYCLIISCVTQFLGVHSSKRRKKLLSSMKISLGIVFRTLLFLGGEAETSGRRVFPIFVTYHVAAQEHILYK